MGTTTPQPAIADLATATKSDRNRAVDAYRVLAMLAVALGHWAAIAVTTDDDGGIVAGNALAEDPSLAWISATSSTSWERQPTPRPRSP